MTSVATKKTPTQTFRVVQWATGNIGSHAMRSVINHPQLELVGVFVHSQAKVGKDAGALCGVSEIGVKATNQLKDIIDLEADCVLYMPQQVNLDDVCQMLASGSNIVTTCTDFYNPESIEVETFSRLENACQTGGTSLLTTGSSPGFISTVLPLALMLTQTRLNRLSINEFANCSSRNSPELIFDIMGFGCPVKEVSLDQRVAHLRNSFGPSLQLLASRLNLPIDKITASGEVVAATTRTEIAAGVIEPGTVGAMRTTVSAMRDDYPVLGFSATWYCATEIDADWTMLANGWQVLVEGDAPLNVVIGFPVEPEDWPSVAPGYTANPAVNAITFVCEASPGILTLADLPHIIPDLGE